jgi:LysM repeat protein
MRRGHFSRLLPLLLVGALALGLLAGCTRDREEEPTPVAADLLAPLPAVEPAPSPAVEPIPGGEPLVQSSTVTDTEATEMSDDGRTIGTYTVESGDTLLSVAIEFNTEVEELRALNLLTDDLIQVGQVLNVPIIPPTPEPTPEPFIHVVAAGESLSGIASRYSTDMRDIITANRLPDANALRAGMELIIPGYRPPAPEGEAGDDAAASTDPDAMGTHTVAAGESLSSIAALYDITVAQLMQANGLTDRNNVRTGTTLRIPGLTPQQALERRSVQHTVAPGESLSEIAQQYGRTVGEIMRANLITDPNTVRSGQVLFIPPEE